MSKKIIILVLFIVFLITYFLQINFFNWFTIAGISPNLFVILIVFISLFAGIKVGLPAGLCTGVFLDIMMGKTFGIYTIMYGIISLLAAYFDKNFSKDSKLTVMLIIVANTLVLEIGLYMFNILMLNTRIEVFYFIRVVLIECFYNGILSIILYPIIKKFGYKIEEQYKSQKLLTRYF